MERVQFSVIKGALVPHGSEAQIVFNKLKIGETVAVEIYRERNEKFAARVAIVIERIGAAFGRQRVRNVRGWLAAATGRADIVSIAGRRVLVPWGTGPRDMSGDEFEAFWEDAIPVIKSEILPTLAASEREDIARMIA